MTETQTNNPGPQERKSGLAAQKTRVISLAFLLVFMGGMSYILYSVFGVVTDAWVAPLNLSPENDKVIQVNIQLTTQLAEMDKLRVEIERIDGTLMATTRAIERLKALVGKMDKAMTWSLDFQTQQAQGFDRVMKVLNEQGEMLRSISRSQSELVQEADAQRQAGLIGRLEYEKERLSLEHLELAQVDNRRSLLELGMMKGKTETELTAWMDGLRRQRGEANLSNSGGIMPEVLAQEESAIRLELELLKLEAEKRALEEAKRIAANTLKNMEELLAQVKARPLYRAIFTNLDLAFIPYEQLENIRIGDTVKRCVWSLFYCTPVGVIEEILPGEVVTQDPWGEMARGQYAILNLTDRDAFKEATLRVRGK